jgi:hypothetical protein
LKKYEGNFNFREIKKLTMNQIILLNHASSVNNERSEEYFEWKKQFDDEDGQPRKAVKVGVELRETEMTSLVFARAMMGG